MQGVRKYIAVYIAIEEAQIYATEIWGWATEKDPTGWDDANEKAESLLKTDMAGRYLVSIEAGQFFHCQYS